MLNDDQYETLYRYTSGEMSDDEKQAFETELASNKELVEEMHRYRQVLNEVNYNRKFSGQEKKVLDETSALNSEFFAKSSTPVKTISSRRKVLWTLVAAACILGLIISANLLLQPNAGEIYQKYATYPALSVSSRGNNNNESLWSQVEYAFNRKDYERCLSLLEQLPDSLLTPRLIVVKGICETETGKYARAERTFERLVTSNDPLKYEAMYYKALKSLKQNHTEDARTFLREIPEDAAIYNKAQNLLDDL